TTTTRACASDWRHCWTIHWIAPGFRRVAHPSQTARERTPGFPGVEKSRASHHPRVRRRCGRSCSPVRRGTRCDSTRRANAAPHPLDDEVGCDVVVLPFASFAAGSVEMDVLVRVPFASVEVLVVLCA